MKSIISVFIILFLFSVCKGQNSFDPSKHDWTANRLVGKVKMVKEITYEGDAVNIKLIKKTEEATFNENGYIIKTYSLESYEKIASISSYSYDRNNKIKEAKMFDSENNEIMKVNYTYSKDGKETDTKVESKSMNITYSEKVINSYNKANQLVGTQTLQDGKVRSTQNIQYSSDQKITEEKRFDSSGTLNSKIIKKFDKKDNLIEKLEYKGSDAKDLAFKVLYKYNDKNHLVEITKYNNDGSIKYKDSLKYLYDKTGNWIKKTEFSNNKISTVTERKIEYF
ncbi:hypothetical protein [Chryseobacterium sp.]|uniref:hypothetical protein n=1 Tax=Chryseobacterium sp. TaxID=1871047 RepID=UPI00321A87D0